MKILIVALLATSVFACVPPLKPFPPLGCTYADAKLVWMSDNSCKWYYIGCGQ